MTPPAQMLDGVFTRLLVSVSHALIHAGGGNALLEGAILRDPVSGFAIEMKDGCNAVTVTLLLCSAVLAFPSPWRRRAWGVLAGAVVLQGLNLVRFISLFYLGMHSAAWFDFAHTYLWESLLVLDAMVLFWWWIHRVAEPERLHAVP